ncbi:xylulokinase [Mucilaginibacter segetis]|uniref:Carbohydrate kinase n=1 Tax=Mucilaginibacter segetis TaxID=2793071 RepID=A0A934PWU3_9SPHI|nr:FGGY family carbohydrate kinase [Mucilaginibacter segetis]MBK0380473.1 carbohydrate kinase [Mucilaginibacter segetis]
MLLLGIDLGTSSVKISIIDSVSQQSIASAQYPDEESPIKSLKSGWAEQSPDMWWDQVQQGILLCHQKGNYDPADIGAIGIAYQMHGLVIVDEKNEALRDSIIWCDSRAVETGNQAFAAIGEQKCLSTLLNSPGNFTASKLAWVKANEPEIYKRISKIMLPGDFIALKLTGHVTSSVSALSEGVFYDFKKDALSQEIISYFDFDKSLFPDILPVFSVHGNVLATVAQKLKLKTGIPVTYKAGDQPNNALSLNVLKPGEVAATAGTSGVIYGVSDQLVYDKESRVNTFAHVNYIKKQKRLGVLLCINGTGSLNRWTKNMFGQSLTYTEMNEQAKAIPVGSDGLRILPFGNGAERMLNNKQIGVHFHHIDLNLHTQAHIFRAVQEGIACAFRYGLDIMRENGMSPSIIRSGLSNLFLSEVFGQSFVDFTGIPVEFYKNDGSVGAALGAGIGVGVYKTPTEAFTNMQPVKLIEPASSDKTEAIYNEWKELLIKQLIIE